MIHRKPWLRIAALLMLLCLLPQWPAQAAKKEATEPSHQEIQTTRTTAVKAPVYKAAKTSSKKLKTLPAGTTVGIVAEGRGWVKISLNGRTGYMKAAAFEAPPEKTPSPTKTPKATKPPKPTKQPAVKGTLMTVVAGDARVYAKARASAESTPIKRGAQVRVLAIDGKWCKVNIEGEARYMPTMSFVVLASRSTKIHQSPSADSKSSTLKKGARLMVLEKDDNWTKVRTDKGAGYVRTEALAAPGVEPDPTPAPTPVATAKAKAGAIPSPKPTKAPKPTAEPTPTPAPKTASDKPAAESKATPRRETASDAYLYQKPSISSKRAAVKAGTTATIFAHNKSWAKVKIGGKAGYMRTSAFEARPATTPKPSAVPAPQYRTLKTGSTGSAVTALQKRLESLGYLNTVPDGKYKSTTASSVREFQGRAGIKQTGIADSRTQSALHGSGAPKSALLGMKLQTGSKGTAVKRLQLRLVTKGYAAGRINGKFGDGTRDAVKRYQSQAGLKADGIAGSATLTALFAPGAASYSADQADPMPEPDPTPTARPTATPVPTKQPPTDSAQRKERADRIVEAAMSKLGLPYVYGSSGPSSFDCSGFTMYAYGAAGVDLPHSAYQQGYYCGTKQPREALRRGDLVCWNTSSDSDLSDHVGVYLGNGRAIHASSGTGRVIISSIDSGYYQRVFSWGRDILG